MELDNHETVETIPCVQEMNRHIGSSKIDNQDILMEKKNYKHLFQSTYYMNVCHKQTYFSNEERKARRIVTLMDTLIYSTQMK
jgi:chromosome condensin MukBEF MukE localization factor